VNVDVLSYKRCRVLTLAFNWRRCGTMRIELAWLLQLLLGSRYFILLSSFPHLNPTAFLSSTGVWNLEQPFPLSSSRLFRGSFLPFSRSSSSRHRRRLLPLFPSPFGVSQSSKSRTSLSCCSSSCASKQALSQAL
jgi:hypothetical protein